MDFFAKPISATNPNATAETLEKQRINWNTGLTGYNTSLKGRKCSAEHRAAVSASKKGTIVSIETRAKLREINLGKPKSAETLAKLSASGKGKPKPKSAEHRAKLSASKKGKLNGGNSKPIMTPNGIYPSHSAVQRAAGVSEPTVYRWMKKWPEHYYYLDKQRKLEELTQKK